MILFNYLIVTVSVLLGLLAALFIGASVYLADGEDEESQELFVTAKVGFPDRDIRHGGAAYPK